MSTFSHTDWTVICDHEGCTAYGSTDVHGGGTATGVRKILKRQGWAVSVPTGREHRADYCPEHAEESPPPPIEIIPLEPHVMRRRERA